MQFEAVYRAHFAVVWRTMRRLGVADKDAWDAAQEVFVTAHRRWNEFDAGSPVKTWLIGIAYRVAAGRRRSAVVRREILDEQPLAKASLELDPQTALEDRELVRLLDIALASLPLEQRIVFSLFEMEGLSGEEIATALGIPLGTVRSRLRLARQAFSRAAQGLPRPSRAVGLPRGDP